jgi:hypothetical protein
MYNDPNTQIVQWQVPDFSASPSRKIGWVESQIQEAEGYLQGQKSYKNLNANMRIFDALFKDKTRSLLITNELKYSINKFCTTLAEVREIASYGSDVPAYKKMAEMLTKIAKCIYLESDFPIQILKVLQYAAVMGIGYLWPKIRPTEYGYGPREMTFDALGVLDVMPTQIPARTNDVQDAYAVTIYDYMPIAEAHGRFPLFQGQLQTVGMNNYKSLIQAERQDFAASWRYGELQDHGKSFGNLYSEIRWTFIRDMRINTTGYELPMGDPGTSWFYKVPSIGQDIFGGMRNGEPKMRPAMAEDCRVYPNLRLIISSHGLDVPMYDGPAFDWDPKIPVIQYTVDDVPWEPGGSSLVGNVGSIQTTIRKFQRQIDQVATAEKDPPVGYSAEDNGGPKLEHWNLFDSSVRLGLFGATEPRKTVQSLLPEGVTVAAIDFEWLKHLREAMLAQLGLNDIGNLANLKLNMNMNSDDASKQIEAIGPIGKGIAMRIEKSNKRVGDRIKYLIPQWFTTRRLIEYVGPDNIAREMFDYNPDDMVPSHLPDEMENELYPTAPSRYDRLTRGKWLAKQMRLISVPSMLLKITAIQEQLKYLQLKRTPDCPISWETVLEKLGLQNVRQEMEKYQKENIELMKWKLIAAALAAEEMKKLGIHPPQEGGTAGGGKGKGGGGGGGGLHPGGRPPSGQKGPRLAQKGAAGGAPRTVVKESS